MHSNYLRDDDNTGSLLRYQIEVRNWTTLVFWQGKNVDTPYQRFSLQQSLVPRWEDTLVGRTHHGAELLFGYLLWSGLVGNLHTC